MRCRSNRSEMRHNCPVMAAQCSIWRRRKFFCVSRISSEITSGAALEMLLQTRGKTLWRCAREKTLPQSRYSCRASACSREMSSESRRYFEEVSRICSSTAAFSLFRLNRHLQVHNFLSGTEERRLRYQLYAFGKILHTPRLREGKRACETLRNISFLD